jgi:hypothetical protein
MKWPDRERESDALNIRVKHDMRRRFFSLRVIDSWNQIPSEVKRMEVCENFRKTYESAESKPDAIKVQPGAGVP